MGRYSRSRAVFPQEPYCQAMVPVIAPGTRDGVDTSSSADYNDLHTFGEIPTEVALIFAAAMRPSSQNMCFWLLTAIAFLSHSCLLKSIIQKLTKE